MDMAVGMFLIWGWNPFQPLTRIIGGYWLRQCMQEVLSIIIKTLFNFSDTKKGRVKTCLFVSVLRIT